MNAQYWGRDPGDAQYGSFLSDAIEFTVGPVSSDAPRSSGPHSRQGRPLAACLPCLSHHAQEGCEVLAQENHESRPEDIDVS